MDKPVLGMFLISREIKTDSNGNLIQALSQYTVTWHESEQKYSIVPATKKVAVPISKGSEEIN